MKLSNRSPMGYWDSVASKYKDSWLGLSKEWMCSQERKFIKNAAEKVSVEHSHCLDIGSGNGRIIDILLDIGFKNISSKDISGEMVTYLRDKYREVKSVTSIEKIGSISDINEKYDFITAIRVLKYSKTWKEDLRNLVNSLNQGGVIVFTIPNLYSTTFFAKYPITKYKTNIFSLRTYLKKLPLEDIRIFSKFRLPDFMYSSKIGLNTSLVKNTELFLDILLPSWFLGKIFFVEGKKS